MHLRGESQEQVHSYLETDFVFSCSLAEILALPIDKHHVSVVEGPVGREGGQGPANKDRESWL